MQSNKYRNIYRNRISVLLKEQGITNLYVIELIEFLFTRTIWINKRGVFKAYLDLRGYICSTLTLPPSLRLIMIIIALRHENQQVLYYKNIYTLSNIKSSTYSLIRIYTLISNVLNEGIHKDINLLLPNSVEDIIFMHYERLYSLFPLTVQESVINILRNPSSSLMLDIKTLNKELNIYTNNELNLVVSPLIESNSINLVLTHISSLIGLNKRGINMLTQIYNSMILDTYQLNQ